MIRTQRLQFAPRLAPKREPAASPLISRHAAEYAGANVLLGEVTAEDTPWNDLPHSASISLPPLGVVWLAHDPHAAAS